MQRPTFNTSPKRVTFISRHLNYLQRLLAVLLLYANALISSASQANQAEPTITVSIKPLALIAKAITGDDANIQVLLPDTANPHHYQLKPSQISLLNDTDLFFWIGPPMESFLPKVLKATSAKHFAVLTLINGDDNDPDSELHTTESNSHISDHEHLHKEDIHLWLQPEFAIEIAHIMTTKLSQWSPARAETYDSNLRRFTAEVIAQDQINMHALEPLTQYKLITAHNLLDGFAKHYGLQIQDIISMTPEQKPGVKHLHELEQSALTSDRLCIISERNQPSRYADILVQNSGSKSTRIDPLASQVSVSTGGYIQFSKMLVDDLLHCLR
ncbi:MAG: zinc ABC transporter substrate-binding protein [Hahellaceae bacterium]|nr:zinc ABC transporter substrate-binding protein [Hahellaceae bacterium]